jgi:hypothetical protein
LPAHRIIQRQGTRQLHQAGVLRASPRPKRLLGGLRIYWFAALHYDFAPFFH